MEQPVSSVFNYLPDVFKQNVDIHEGGQNSKKRKFSCQSCGKSFSRKYQVVAHKRIHTGEKPFSCQACAKSFRLLSSLTNHQKACSKNKQDAERTADQMTASVSRNNSPDKSYLDGPKSNHTGDKPHSCQDCGKSFALRKQLIIHQIVHKGERPFSCSKCDKSFKDFDALKTHCEIHTQEKPFRCQACGMSFRRRHHLTRHNMIHTGEKPFACQTCGLRFRLSQNLKNHCKIHDRPEKDKTESIHDKTSPITVTQRVDIKNAGQNTDMLSPIQSKPSGHQDGDLIQNKKFPCKECGLSFTRKYKLIVHETVHTGEKSFSCPYCKKSFRLKHHLISHQKKKSKCQKRKAESAVKEEQTEMKSFPCRFCDKSFPGRYHLERHERIHTGEKPFACKTCDRRFNQNESLLKHQKSHDRPEMGASSVKGNEDPNIAGNVASKHFLQTEITNIHTQKVLNPDFRSMQPVPNIKIEVVDDPILGQGREMGLQHNSFEKNTDEPNELGELIVPERTIGHTDQASNLNVIRSELNESIEEGQLGTGIQITDVRSTLPDFNMHQEEQFLSQGEQADFDQNLTSDQIIHGDLDPMKRPKNYPVNLGGPPKKSEVIGERCLTCNKTFKKKSALKEHVTMHTGEKPFSCQVCGDRFRLKDGLHKHQKRRHKSMAEGESPKAWKVKEKPEFKSESRDKLTSFLMEKAFTSIVSILSKQNLDYDQMGEALAELMIRLMKGSKNDPRLAEIEAYLQKFNKTCWNCTTCGFTCQEARRHHEKLHKDPILSPSKSEVVASSEPSQEIVKVPERELGNKVDTDNANDNPETNLHKDKFDLPTEHEGLMEHTETQGSVIHTPKDNLDQADSKVEENSETEERTEKNGSRSASPETEVLEENGLDPNSGKGMKSSPQDITIKDITDIDLSECLSDDEHITKITPVASNEFESLTFSLEESILATDKAWSNHKKLTAYSALNLTGLSDSENESTNEPDMEMEQESEENIKHNCDNEVSPTVADQNSSAVEESVTSCLKIANDKSGEKCSDQGKTEANNNKGLETKLLNIETKLLKVLEETSEDLPAFTSDFAENLEESVSQNEPEGSCNKSLTSLTDKTVEMLTNQQTPNEQGLIKGNGKIFGFHETKEGGDRQESEKSVFGEVKCSICGKIFASKYNLSMHESVHTGEKPHKCLLCGKVFRLKKGLRKHEKSHSNDSGIESGGSMHPMSHESGQEGERPYACETCYKTFKDKSGLKKHQRIHSEDKQFKCEGCNKGFTYKGNLTTHLKGNELCRMTISLSNGTSDFDSDLNESDFKIETDFLK